MSERLAFSCQHCGGAFVTEHRASGVVLITRLCDFFCDEPESVLLHRAQAVEEVAGSDELHDRALAAKETDPSELRRKVNRIVCNRDQLDAEQEYIDNTHNVFRP